MKPALFIGFGGTGAIVLQKSKYAIAKYFHDRDRKGATKVTDADIPACFRFIEVDIDTDSAAPQGGDSSAVLPFDLTAGTELFVAALNTDFQTLESEISKSHAEVDKAVRTWWPEGLGRDLHQRYQVAPSQAFQIRQVGRLALWKNHKEFSAMVSSAIAALKNRDLIAEVNRRYPGLTLNVLNGINIFVATSGAGGTGCGMVLDGLALITDAKANEDTVNTFILLPSTYKELVMGKEGDSGYRATQVNAYALLKELDGIKGSAHGSYTEDFTGAGRTVGAGVVPYGSPSTYTYLVTDTLENGQNLGGKGVGAAAQVAGLVTNLCLGLQDMLDKMAGRRARVTQNNNDFGWPVAAAYSAFGHASFSYPQELLTEYARQHIIKRLGKIFIDRISDARKKGEVPPVTEKDIDASMDLAVQGEEQIPVWMGELLPWSKLNRCAFDAATVENYAAKKRRDIVRVMLADHQRAVEDVQAWHERRMEKKATTPLIATIENRIAERVGRYLVEPWYGLAAAIKYVETLYDSAVNQLKLTESANEVTRKAHTEFHTDAQLAESYGDIANWRICIFTAGREQRIRQLLSSLQTDCRNVRSACDGDFKAAMIQGVIDVAKGLGVKLESLRSAASIMGLNARTEEKRISDELLIPAEKAGKLFGCSRAELDVFEAPFKKAAEELLALLNKEVCDTGFAWPEALVRTKADAYATGLHQDKGFLPRFKAHFNVEIARTDSTQDILQFLVAKVKSASPMIPKPDIPTSPNYCLMAKFTEQEFKAACNEKQANDISFTQMDSVDNNSIIAVAIRDGLIAGKVKEVLDLFKVYAVNKAVPRPDRFPKLSAHILKDAAEWNDIVPSTEGGKGRAFSQVSDPGRYIALALELGMLRKDTKGSWYRFALDGEPKKVPMEENPNQWEMKNMLLAFEREDFIKQLREVAIARIQSQYADLGKYAAFRVKTPKMTVKASRELGIDTTRRIVPEDMDKEILTSRNWTEEQCAKFFEQQANA